MDSGATKYITSHKLTLDTYKEIALCNAYSVNDSVLKMFEMDASMVKWTKNCSGILK